MGYYSNALIESPDLLKYRTPPEPGRPMDDIDKTSQHGSYRVWFMRGFQGQSRVEYCQTHGQAHTRAHELCLYDGYRVSAQYWHHGEQKWIG